MPVSDEKLDSAVVAAEQQIAMYGEGDCSIAVALLSVVAELQETRERFAEYRKGVNNDFEDLYAKEIVAHHKTLRELQAAREDTAREKRVIRVMRQELRRINDSDTDPLLMFQSLKEIDAARAAERGEEEG